MITVSNYEIYFLDYFEGRLTTEKIAELLLFLEHHPGLKSEFESFENISLDTRHEEFEGKESLKKTEINESNIQQFLIAGMEGDLEESQRNELNAFVAAHPVYENDRRLYAHSRLAADDAIKFYGKGSLKRTRMFATRTVVYAAGIAAGILIFLGIYFYNISDISPTTTTVAMHDDFKNGIQNNNKTTAVDSAFNSQPLTATINTPVKSSEKNALAVNKKAVKKQLQQVAYNGSEKLFQSNKKQNKVQVNYNVEGNIALEPLVFIPVKNIESFEKNPASIQIAQSGVPVLQHGSSSQNIPQGFFDDELSETKPLNVMNAISHLANEKIAQLTGNDDFANNIHKKKKLLDVITWVVNKVGGKKVKMETQYDAENKLATLQFSTAGFSIEHVKGY